MPKNATRKTSKNLFFDKFCHLEKAAGKNIIEAKKNLINARVNGGIFSRANLKIGEAAPQIMLEMIKATIGFIYVLLFDSNKQLTLQ